MISWLIHNPSPVPLIPLVVKKGSNAEASVAPDIPDPVSATVMDRPRRPVVQSVPSRPRSRSRPPRGIASSAFPSRLLSTCRISPSKHSTATCARLRLLD